MILAVLGLLLLGYVIIFLKNEDSTKSRKKLALEVTGIILVITGAGIWVWSIQKKVTDLKAKMKSKQDNSGSSKEGTDETNARPDTDAKGSAPEAASKSGGTSNISQDINLQPGSDDSSSSASSISATSASSQTPAKASNTARVATSKVASK